jgi:osmotically-inducible protein OsmY
MAGVRALAVEMLVKLSELGKRTDADIARSVENVLSLTNSVPPAAVSVMVENGWLTLSGDVEWQYQRQDAADSVRHILGVTGVSNQISIKPAILAQVVKADIEAVLKRRAVYDASTIHNWAERDLATRAAWGTAGVRHVVDQLTLAY